MYSGYTLSYQLTEKHVPKVYNTVCTLDTHCRTNWQSNMYLRSTIQCVLWIHIVIPTDRATCIQGLQYSEYSGYKLSYQLIEQHYLRPTIQCVLWIHIVIPTDRATCIQGLQYSGYTLSYQLTQQHVSNVYNTVSTLDTYCHSNWQSNMYLRSTIQCVLWIHIVIPPNRATC